jgi:hypothetical protein
LRSDTVEEFQDIVEGDFSVVELGCDTLRLGLRWKLRLELGLGLGLGPGLGSTRGELLGPASRFRFKMNST